MRAFTLAFIGKRQTGERERRRSGAGGSQIDLLHAKVAAILESVIDLVSEEPILQRVEVTWEHAKNLANQRKHKVGFEEASELFRSGSDYVEIFDVDHSLAEDRFIAIGPIRRGLVLVIWTERDEESVHMISARWATRHEQELYRSYLEGIR